MIARSTALVFSVFVGLGSACGPAPVAPGDTYYGPIDATALAPQLRAVTGARCTPYGATTCYLAHQVSLRGGKIKVHHLGAISSGLTFGAGGTLPSSWLTGAAYAYTLQSQCSPNPIYDPVADPYASPKQFPIFSALPLAPPPPSTAVVLPIVRVAPVTAGGYECNALKRTQSVESGLFGAAPTDNKVAPASLWAVIDPGAYVVPLSSTSTVVPQFGWFRGLILSYLDGGRIPLSSGEIRTMEAVIVDPDPTGSSSTLSDDVIILAFGPGDTADYSPFVRLRHLRAAPGMLPSAYTRICTSVSPGAIPGCTGLPDEVDIATASPPVEMLTIAAGP